MPLVRNFSKEILLSVDKQSFQSNEDEDWGWQQKSPRISMADATRVRTCLSLSSSFDFLLDIYYQRQCLLLSASSASAPRSHLLSYRASADSEPPPSPLQYILDESQGTSCVCVIKRHQSVSLPELRAGTSLSLHSI